MPAIKATGIFCSSASYGGLEINTLRLIKWMQQRGREIPALFTEDSPLLREAQEQKSATTSFSKSTFYNRLRQLRHWVKRHNIQILIIPYNRDLKLAALYKRFFNPRLKLIYQQHMQVGVTKRSIVHTRRFSMLDAWIAPLQYLKTEALQKTRVPEHKVRIIPFGIEPSTFLDAEIRAGEARELLGLPSDVLVIGTLGRLDPKKGQDVLITALNELHHNQNIEAHLLLAGDATLNEGDKYSQKIGALIEELGLEKYVHLRPYQKDVTAFFRAVDVFAMTSHNETYGMVTLEAMASGVPVIGTDSGGTAELLEHGSLGYLFEPENATDLVRAFIEMKEDTQLQDRLQAAQAKVLEYYSAEKMCRSLEILLAEM